MAGISINVDNGHPDPSDCRWHAGEDVTVTIEVYDRDNQLAVPDSMKYSIYCSGNQQEVVPETVVANVQTQTVLNFPGTLVQRVRGFGEPERWILDVVAFWPDLSKTRTRFEFVVD